MRAHLLVSLHADVLNNRSVRGASVYWPSPKSSDAQAEEFATNNNLVVSAGSIDTHELPLGVSAIMEDLIFREKQVFSFEIQRSMVTALGRRVPLLKNPERHGNFLLLRTGNIPSILLEMGFRSNLKDEALLNDNDDQHKIVLGSVEAIIVCVHRFAAVGFTQ